jgi:hypothetical protein
MQRFVLTLLLVGIHSSDASAQPIRKFFANRAGACATSAEASACSQGACSTAAVMSSGTVQATVVSSRVGVASGNHPIAHQWVRLKFTAFLVKKGYSRADARLMADSLSDQMLEQAGAQVGAPGGFFQNLLAALQQCEQDPTCSKFLAALMTYLLTLLGG